MATMAMYPIKILYKDISIIGYNTNYIHIPTYIVISVLYVAEVV